MDGRLIVLYRFVEALGEDANIQSFQDRKRFQKAVYLGQVAGVDIGYRYGWYVKGPYSTELARDYYSLSEALAGGEAVPSQQQLRADVHGGLAKAKSLFNVPADMPLGKPDWLELLASWHYLRQVSKLDENAAREYMQQRKANLVQWIPDADRVLKDADLLH